MECFKGWDNGQFACWLAGFFDGEGCIYLSPKRNSIEISISGTNKEVIMAIRERLQVGTVAISRYNDPTWHDKITWRVRSYADCYSVICLMRPFLTIKAPKADEAIERYRFAELQREDQLHRNNEIMRMLNEGIHQKKIAEHFGLCQSSISQIRLGFNSESSPKNFAKYWGPREFRAKKNAPRLEKNSHVSVVLVKSHCRKRSKEHPSTPLLSPPQEAEA